LINSFSFSAGTNLGLALGLSLGLGIPVLLGAIAGGVYFYKRNRRHKDAYLTKNGYYDISHGYSPDRYNNDEATTTYF
jgi:hypothetical protein